MKPRIFKITKQRIFKIVLVLIVAWVILAAVAPRGLVVSAPLASADAIVVMSGSSTYRERTQKAAQLYHEGRAPVVLLTDDHTQGGWDSAKQRNPFFVERAREELIRAGVPADAIRIAPGIATSTHEEAVIIKDYAVAERIRSLFLVTSAYHSRRALRTLRRTLDGTDTAIGIEPVVSDSSRSAFWWLQPEGWRTVGGEYVKLIYYWFKYD